MKFLFHLFILALCGKLVSSFDCPDITNQTKCDTLGFGCSWDDTGCIGSFVHTDCTGCVYVDSYSTGTNAGTTENPYQTLNAALLSANLASSVLTVIILNYKDETVVIQTAVMALIGTHTVKPLFEDETYTMDFTQVPLNTAMFGTTSFIRAAKYLYLKGAVIEHTFSPTYVTYVIDAGSSGATVASITLENVHWRGCTLSSTITSFNIRVVASQSGMAFTYLGGTYTDSNTRFSVLGGTANWKDFKVISPRVLSPLFVVGNTNIFENLYVTDTPALYTLFNLAANSRTTIVDSLFEYTRGVFNSGVNHRFLSVENSTFRHLVAETTSYIVLSGVATTGDKLGENFFKNCTFENISAYHSVMTVQNGGIQLTFDTVSMDNLRKIQSNTPADLQLEAQWPGGLCALLSTEASLTVKNSNFTNIYGHCFGTRITAVTVEDSIFDNSNLDETPITLTATTVNSLNRNSGTSWVNIEDLGQTGTLGFIASFKRNTFKTNKRVSLYGGAIRYAGVNIGQLYLEDNQFIGLTAGYGGAVYGGNALISFNLSGNTFEDNKAFDGGAIYKVSQQASSKPYIPSTNLEGDQFIGNKALRNGGGMFLNWESLGIKNGVFTYNQAGNGGGIFFVFLDTLYNKDEGKLTGTSFTHNHAENAGGAIKMFSKYSELNDDSTSPTYFFNNTDIKNTTGISEGKPAYYIFSFYNVLVEKTFSELDDLTQWVKNATRTSLDFRINASEPSSVIIPHKSGHQVDHIVGIEVYDEEGNLADYISEERVVAEVISTTGSVSNFTAYAVASPVHFSFKDGAVYFKTTLKLVGEPLSQATVRFRGVESSSNMLRSLGLILNFNLQFSFNDCEIGDIYDNVTKTCDTCPAGTYSLADPYGPAICRQCDFSQQLCLGGRKISPQPGFWRYDVNLPVVIACPEPSACPGGLVNERFYEQGMCEFPYEGNLCNTCAINYAKFGSSESCTDCSKDSLYYVKFVGFFALRIGAVVYSIKVNLNKVSGNKKKKEGDKKGKKSISNEDFQSNLMKIVVNFLQVSSIIFLYRFDWPDFIMRIVDVTNKIVPTNSEGFSVDCLVALVSQDNQNIYFIKLVVTLLEPLALWLGLIGIYALYLKYKKEQLKGNPEVKKNIVVLFVITAFIVQPSLIQATLELFKCTNLRTPEDPAYYMTKSPNVECWTPKHILWSIGIAFPFFLLWGVVLPIVLLRKLMARAKSLHNPEVYSKYAFVYEGLKTKRYYWEFVTLVRKTLIIVIFVFLNVISVQAQAFATFLVIMFFTALHVKFRPYSDKRLNRLELFSLVTLGIMTYCGMFFLSGGSNDTITILLIIVSLIFNMAFYGAVGIYFLKSYRKTAQKVTRKITTKVKESLERSRSRSQKSSNSDSSSHSDADKSKHSVDVKELEDIMDGINIDSPSKKDPNEDDSRKNSVSSISGIPSETDDSPNTDKRIALGLGDSGNQSSIVRNFGIKQLSSLHHQNSFNNNNNLSYSINNSSINLLSPNLINSAMSSNRRPNNLSLQIENNVSHFLRTKKPVSELSADGKQNDQLDSPRAQRHFNLGVSYEDSPRGGISRIHHQGSYQDDSLILKIPNSPSEIRSGNGSEEMVNKD